MVVVAALFATSGCISFAGLTGGGDGGSDGASDGSHRLDAGGDRANGEAEAAGDCNPLALNAASSLEDSFDASTLSPEWFTPNNESCAVQSGGALVAEAHPSYCLFFTVSQYHLTCSSFTVEVPETTLAKTGVQTVIYLDTSVHDAGQTSLILENGGFQFTAPDKASSMLGAYSATEDHWWRLVESNGSLSFWTSQDGEHFTMKGSIPDPMPLEDVIIALGAGEYDTIPDAGQAKFRCVNLSPPSCQ